MKFTAAATLALVASASAFAPAPTVSVSKMTYGCLEKKARAIESREAAPFSVERPYLNHFFSPCDMNGSLTFAPFDCRLYLPVDSKTARLGTVDGPQG